MNAITDLDCTDAHLHSATLLQSAVAPTVAPAGVADRLKPARGLVIGLVLSVGFWIAVGTLAALLIGR